MNDADIELIIALVAGDLAPDEEAAAHARIEASAELRDAYDQQLTVATTLKEAPAIQMTAAERDALHTNLRSELRIEAAPVAAAPSPSRSRWWLAIGGLATAAVAIFAFAIVPDIMDGGGDIVFAPTAETPAANLDTLENGEAEAIPDATTEAAASDGAGADATTAAPPSEVEEPTTTAAAEESAADTTVTQAAEPVYYLSPVVARSTVFSLPILDEAVVAASGLELAIAEATEFFALQIDDLVACFSGEAGSGDRAFQPEGYNIETTSVYGTATDLESGDQETLVIALDTCEITTAG